MLYPFNKTPWSRGAQAGVLAVFGQVGVVLQKDLPAYLQMLKNYQFLKIEVDIVEEAVKFAL
ncbi:hypothetical protein L484_022536 [Morus notabilis]|uniref:Uncharacterized protein n=1 Tax=Morus notabilis TaxID=981085 RepID=W9QUI7_9ROSA|nr:hypothetical protein L484_022536 [Morus notabilis]